MKNLLDMIEFVPSDEDLADIAMSFRHDYGLLSLEEQRCLRFEASEWLRACCYNKNFIQAIKKASVVR